eukprot:NODE_605_length_1331_cov_1.836379_g566_i0.p1 GENE.NODE_605_length_1331_cov_1.836379_g566_i0~~NODE_605_length_1331_cov_1.836379_g566_i0.p1  ORF type:complete len:442 (+),score=65.70 NODE_605_length_1331_cov_1.836379_g566_i0:63-1328(+)
MAKVHQACIFLVLLVCWFSDAKSVSGSRQTRKGDFTFLAKFAYDEDYGSGSGSLDVRIESLYNTQKLLIYLNEETWNEAYYRNTECVVRENLASFVDSINTETEEGTFALVDYRQITNATERIYLFLAISNCGNPDVQLERYHVVFLQQDGSHFSIDEYGILTIYAVYFVAYIFLIFVHSYGLMVLARSAPIHPIYYIFTASLAFDMVNILFNMIDQAIYSNNGVGSPGMGGFGDFCEMVSHVIFLALLLLIANGWTISTVDIRRRNVLFVFLGLYTLLYLIVFIVWKAGTDPASTKNEFQSVAGGFLLAFQLISFFYFLYCLRLTYREESVIEKLMFYKTFGIVFSLWFVALPFTVMIIAGVNSTSRDKVVVAMLSTINFLSLCIMAGLLWPSRSYKYFKVAPPNLDQHTKEDALPYGSI